VSFLDIEDSVALKTVMFSKHSEVMVAREVSALDVELVKNMSIPRILSPHFLNVRIFEFMMPMMMVLADLHTEEPPMLINISV
jgi:hypothetical protein